MKTIDVSRLSTSLFAKNDPHRHTKEVLAYNLSLPKKERLNRKELIAKYGVTEWSIRKSMKDRRVYELCDKIISDTYRNRMPDVLEAQMKKALAGNLGAAKFISKYISDREKDLESYQSERKTKIIEADLDTFLEKLRQKPPHQTSQIS